MNKPVPPLEPSLPYRDLSDGPVTANIPLRRVPRKPLPHYTRWLLPALSVASGLMLTTALPALISASGVLDYFKCAVIGLAATATSYGISRLAVEKGAMQAAVGTMGAAAVSTGSILAVGAGMFAATYSGFVVEETDRLRLEGYARAEARAIDAQIASAREAARIAPAVKAMAQDLEARAQCELSASCVSGNGSGGAGPVYRALSAEALRAGALLDQVRSGEAQLVSAAEYLARLQGELQSAVAGEGLSSRDRRLAAQAAAAEIGQATSALQEAAPVALTRGYAGSLAASNSGARVGQLLTAHREQLDAVLAEAAPVEAARPEFPARTGVSDTLTHIHHFLPIAAIVAVVELVFPLTLWLYTYFALLGRLERDDPREAGSEPGAVSQAGKTRIGRKVDA